MYQTNEKSGGNSEPRRRLIKKESKAETQESKATKRATRVSHRIPFK